MNIYTKKTKKFILVLVLLMLFNFCYPKQVKAIDFGGNISSFFFWIEEGVIKIINKLFCDELEEHKYIFEPELDEVQVNLTPENIIKGKFILFNANIFDELDEDKLESYYDGGFNWLSGAKTTLRNTISGWYYSLRNFAIVALLSVLVYVGIRMVTSTISQDKAKYKTMFKDWLVAICLLVVMQYIMIGVLNVTDKITDAIRTDGGGGSQIGNMMSLIYNINACEDGDDGWGETRYTDPQTNNEYTLSDAFGYELLLLCQAVFMVIFAWKYLKREFTVIFLILLGPISCITYPIDKISDGKAQAFNNWLKEFIYNVLVQPFHLLLYTVLCGSAVELANNNILYGIACLAMLIPAEKFVKEMFGFKDKLGGGPLAAASMGAIGSQLANKLKSGGSGKSSKNTGNDSTDSKDNTQIRTKKPDGSVLTDGKVGDTQAENGGGIHNTDNTNIDDIEEQTSMDGSIETQNELPIEDESTDGLPIENSPETQDENSTNNADGSDQNERSEISDASSQDKQSFGSRLKQAHRERLAEKYGTADTKKIWGKRGIKAAKTLGKGTYKAAKGSLKVAGALSGAAVGAAVGLLSGKGIAAGAAVGYNLTGRAIKKAENSIGNVVGDYKDRMQTPEKKEKKQKEKFMENKDEIKKAIGAFKERNNGVGPSAEQFEKEMEDRYELKSYGMKDDDIDDAIELYQAELEQQKNNGKSDEEAKKIAASKTVEQNKLKNMYSADKFTDPKNMNNLLNSTMGRLKAQTGCSDDVAYEYARQHIINAGKMHGLKEQQIALPPVKKKLTVPSSSNLYGKLKFENTAEGESQKQQVQAIQDVLVEVGFDNKQIEQVMSYSTGSSNEEIIESFATNVKYIVSNDVSNNSNVKVEEIKSGTQKVKIEKNEVVMTENLEKLGIEKTLGIKDEKTKSKIRELEKQENTTKYREIAGKDLRGEFSKNDKNNLSQKNLDMITEYRKIVHPDEE